MQHYGDPPEIWSFVPAVYSISTTWQGHPLPLNLAPVPPHTHLRRRRTTAAGRGADNLPKSLIRDRLWTLVGGWISFTWVGAPWCPSDGLCRLVAQALRRGRAVSQIPLQSARQAHQAVGRVMRVRDPQMAMYVVVPYPSSRNSKRPN
jgi:hypothetical protein